MRILSLAHLIWVLALVGCVVERTAPSEDDPGSEPPVDEVPTEVQFTVEASIGGNTIEEAALEVSGPGIARPIVQNLVLEDGVRAYTTVMVPVGSARTFTVRGYAGSAIETHRGSATIDIDPESSGFLEIELERLLGELPIEVGIGSYSLTLSPVLDTLAVGESLEYEVVVLDLDGAEMDPEGVVWDSSNPAVAGIDESACRARQTAWQY